MALELRIATRLERRLGIEMWVGEVWLTADGVDQQLLHGTTRWSERAVLTECQRWLTRYVRE